jgi:hypothetical protein
MIHSSLVPHLERHNGVDGLQGALLDMKIPVTQVLVDDPGILLDVNTPEDFKRLRRTGRENTSDSQLWPATSHLHFQSRRRSVSRNCTVSEYDRPYQYHSGRLLLHAYILF